MKRRSMLLKRHNSGRWFACISVEIGFCVLQKKPKKIVGVDVGIEHFLADSE